MNWFFKLLVIYFAFILGMEVWGREQILITYNLRSDLSHQIKKVIEEKLGLGQQFLSIRHQPEPCHESPEAIMQICIPDQGEFRIVVLRDEILKRNIAPLIKPEEETSEAEFAQDYLKLLETEKTKNNGVAHQ